MTSILKSSSKKFVSLVKIRVIRGPIRARHVFNPVSRDGRIRLPVGASSTNVNAVEVQVAW
jgi:hypothetical protein